MKGQEIQDRPSLAATAESTDSSMTSIEVLKASQNESKVSPTNEKSSQDYGDTIHGSSKIACLPHMEGHKLWLLIAVLCGGLLLSTLETTIIATALISISSDLNEYNRSNWIVAAYLLTYTGFLIIFARWSDIFGRRSTYMVALTIFTLFSLGCGLAQTMNQLIILRAFQGIGGAGLYSLSMGVATEVPGKLRGPIGGLLSVVFAISSVAGPPIGGAITSNTTWRWVFLFNVPVGVVLMVITFFIFPKNSFPLKITSSSFKRIDWLGIVLSLGAMVALLFAIEEGGLHYAWNSPPIIGCFVAQGILWVAFAAWETFLTRKAKVLQIQILPILPSRLFSRRVICCAMITAFLLGFPFMTAIIFLPQRFQLENGYSAAAAGVRMLPLLLLSSFAAGVGGFLVQIKNISFQLLVVSASLQLLGLGLMSSLPIGGGVTARQYGFQIILGVGFGLSLSTLPLIARLEVEKEDHAVSMGAITQIRVLGGLVGIVVSQAILSDHVDTELATILSPEQISALARTVESIADFTSEQAAAIRESYGGGFNLQFRVMMYFAVVCLLVTLGCWIRNPMDVQARERVEEQNRKRRIEQESKANDLEGGQRLDASQWAINDSSEK